MNDTATLTRPSPARPRRGGRPAFVQRYWAFLSYSHKDAEVADWLHSSLEKFRVPKAMIGRGTPFGLVPARLTPVFRDQHDLAAGDDLREDIQLALGSSRFLLVLCSPAAVASRWVDEEVRLFKQLRPDGEVLAAIVAGEPWAADIPGREAEECFPAALKEELDESGLPTGERAEPIAADLRTQGDGRQLGLQKLIAGMLDVGLDDLVQRDAHRRQRRMLALTGASVTGMIVTSGLALMAVQARDEARDQRREAEGLVGFMLGDLKDKLEPIGRLDTLDAVGARALNYYAKQDRESLSDDGLSQRARALTLMGDIAQRRGDLEGAIRRYREAGASTSELLRRHPEDPQRMYDHGQNLFYFGSVAWQRGRLAEATRGFAQYRDLTRRMIAAEPQKKEWRLEGVYADQNIGMALLRSQRFAEAERMLEANRRTMEELVAGQPRDLKFQYQLLETLAYLADANTGAGHLAAAIERREQQLAIIKPLQIADPGDLQLTRKGMRAHHALAGLHLMRGEVPRAQASAELAVGIGNRLLASEPDNTAWVDRTASAYLTAAAVSLAAGQPERADSLAQNGCRLADRLIARDASVIDWSEMLRRQCLLRQAEVAQRRGLFGEALALAERAITNARSARQDTPQRRSDLAEARLIAGDALAASNRTPQARQQWQAGLQQWPSESVRAPGDLAIRAQLLKRVGEDDEARATARRLSGLGYRHPTFIQSFGRGV